MLCYRCGSFTPDDSRKCQVCGQPIAMRRRQSSKISAVTTGQLRHVPPFDPGELVANRYRVIEPATPGTTGWVMRVRDEEVDVDVALKVIGANLLQTEEERSKFQRAVKSARKVHHPNVVRIYDDGRADRYLYYTMPFLEGLSLRKIIDLRLERQQVFALNETLPLFAQVALAIDNLSKHGAHGAMRPANITILPDVLKLTGLPHFAGLPRKPFVAQLSSAHAIDYLAPEARRDDGEADRRADVYSLAVIFAEMVTGVVYGRDAEAWSAAEEKLPPRLVAVLHRAFSESPDGRFETAAGLFESLAGAAAEMQGTLAPSGPTEPVPLEEREHTDVDGDRRGAPTVDLSGSRQVPKSALVKRSAPARELSRGARRAAALSQIERRGVGRRMPATVPLIVAVILLTGLAISAALYYARQRAGVDELLPVQDNQDAPPPTPISPGPPDKPDRPHKAGKAPPSGEPRDRDRTKGKRDGRRSDREPEPPPVAPAPVTPPPVTPPPVTPPPVTPPPVTPPPVTPPPPSEPVAALTPPAPEPPLPATPADEPGRTRCPPGMVPIEGGSFTLGAAGNDAMRGFGELAATSRSVDPFCIDVYEFPNEKGKQPTVNVSWTRAKKACERVNKRLCTEIEWERACKGPGGTRFPYGNGYDAAYCNVGEGAEDARKPGAIGVFPRCRSGFGVVDMGGNVAEWTSSSWGRSMSDKVVKGGSADQAAYMSRCAARANESPDGRQANIGFRCCADLKR